MLWCCGERLLIQPHCRLQLHDFWRWTEWVMLSDYITYFQWAEQLGALMGFVWLPSHTWRYSVFLRNLSTRQMPCCIAVWSHWAVQKWLNWNLIFFHLSHYWQIESPAAVLCSGPQSRQLFLDFNLTASKNVTFCCLDALPRTRVIHAVASAPVGLWSFADLPLTPGHHPWHCLSPGVTMTLWAWSAWCAAVGTKPLCPVFHPSE